MRDHRSRPLGLGGGLLGVLLVSLVARSAVSCPPAQVSALEAALQAAPLSTEDGEAGATGGRVTGGVATGGAATGGGATGGAAVGSGAAPAVADPPRERRCGTEQALIVRQVLAACRPRPEQSVMLLGGGRCLHQAGLRGEATRAYRDFLRLSSQDKTVPGPRNRDRRERVRRWLVELGEEAPPTATLVLRSNLRGAMVRHLDGFPEGVTIAAGEVRLPQPPGSRVLSLSLPGFRRVEMPVDLVDAVDTHAAVDWRQQLTPRYAGLAGRWDDFQKSGLSPAGYLDRGRRPLPILLGLLAVGAGAALIAVCATNAGDSCDATWKQGVAYGAGAVLATGGVIVSLSAWLTQAEQLPPALLSGDGSAAPIR